MFKKLALLAAALTLTMPVFAQGTTTSGSTAAPAAATTTTTDAKPAKAKKHHAAKHSHKKAKEADAPKN
jgi:hypothetical protein